MYRTFFTAIFSLLAALWIVACSSDSRVSSSGGGHGNDDDDNDDNNGSGSDGDGDDDDDRNCGESAFEITREPVDMLIVLDHSLSMAGWDGQGNKTGPDLWTPLVGYLKQITSELESQINFGLILFPSADCKCDPLFPLFNDDPCITSTAVDVPIGESNAPSAISGVIENIIPCGGTPMAATLREAKTYLDTVNSKYDKYVLLATDGAPHCNGALTAPCTCIHANACSPMDINSGLNCLDDKETYSATQALSSAGYKVHVLGIGTYVNSVEWANVLTGIAQAGGTGQYYPAEQTDQVLAALRQITGKLVNCQFTLDWDSIPDKASDDPKLVNFYCKEKPDDNAGLDNVIGLDDGCKKGEGWSWTGDDTIELCDGACQKLRDSVCTTITATFGCETIVVE